MATDNNLSPNMNLPVPVVGVAAGPQYATYVDSCLSLIDAHNHTLGSGVPVPVAGLNINANLGMNGYGLGSLGYITFTPGTLAINDSLYVSGVDLHFIDGNGNNVQLTSGGVVNATSSGISSGTATAAFSGGVLVVKSAASTAANIDGASLVLRNTSSYTYGLTLSPPTLSSNYSVVLPALPGATSIMQMDTSGNMSASLLVDNASLQNSGTVLSVKAGGITQAMMTQRTNAATGVTAGNVLITGSSGASLTTSTGVVVPGSCSGTIATLGNPVQIQLQPDGTSNASYFGQKSASAGGMVIFINRDGTQICNITPAITVPGLSEGLFPMSFSFLDVGATAGTHTYEVQIASLDGTAVYFYYGRLVAYEIK